MSLNRREALIAMAAAPAALAAPRTKLAVSTYSYWHFKGSPYPLEKVIEDAAEIGFEGVELLHRQFASESASYLNGLRRAAFERGLSLVMLSIHQDFVYPNASDRAMHVSHTRHCLELCARLGMPAMRLNSGRWKTIPSFDDLMKVKGNEPPLAGYTNDDAVKWCVESIEQCLPDAERLGVVMCLENHWGLTTNIDTLLKIHSVVNSPWLGINLDTGNYPDEAYPGIAKLAPKATIVQAKTYYGGGEWYTLDLDYPRIAGILKKAGYHGWVSLEMEGREDPKTAVRKSFDVLSKAFTG